MLLKPSRRPEPSAKIAASCLGAIAMMIGVLGLLLAVGAYFDVRPLIYLPFGIAIFPPVWGTLGGIYYLLVIRPKRRKRERDFAAPATAPVERHI